MGTIDTGPGRFTSAAAIHGSGRFSLFVLFAGYLKGVRMPIIPVVRKRTALALAVVVVVVALASSLPRVRRWMAVDRCLDRGGSYDYVADRCDFEISHPVPSR
jgi:hypothetical protein